MCLRYTTTCLCIQPRQGKASSEQRASIVRLANVGVHNRWQGFIEKLHSLIINEKTLKQATFHQFSTSIHLFLTRLTYFGQGVVSCETFRRQLKFSVRIVSDP